MASNEFNPIDKVSIDELTPDLQESINDIEDNSIKIDTHIATNDIHITNAERGYWNAKAETKNPVFTGVPLAPTADAGSYSNQIATTQFVKTEFDLYYPEEARVATKLKKTVNIGVSGLAIGNAQEFDGTKDISIPIVSLQTSALLGTIGKGSLSGTYDIDITGYAGDAYNADNLGEIPASSYALLASPTFTGAPKAPTAATGDSSKLIANTEYVVNTIANTPSNKLATSRNFSITGIAFADPVAFDGTNDVVLRVKEIDGTTIENVDAAIVNGHTVDSDVPENAVFTDTVYVHPEPENKYESSDILLGVKVDKLGHVVEGFNPESLNLDITGNATSADKLSSPRTIALNGGVTAEATTDFGEYSDYYADVNITVTSIDPNYIVQTETHRMVSDSQIQTFLDKYTRSETDALLEAVVSGIDWKEAVATYDDLAIMYPDAEEGWTSSAIDDNMIYRFDGEKWVNISSSIDMPLATEEVNGIMSSNMVKKFNTIEEYANNYIHPETHSVSMITGLHTVATSGSYTDLINRPTTMTANGGNSDTVNGHTVESDVPPNAIFTDTVYVHPETHDASMIIQSEDYRFVSDDQIDYWDAKASTNVVSTSNNGLMSISMLEKLDGIEKNANKYIHPTSGVVAGTYNSVKVDENGHITEGFIETDAGNMGITDVSSTIVSFKDPNIVKSYDRAMACFAPYNGVTINSPLITNYLSNPSTLKSLISIDTHLYIPGKANLYFTINININQTSIDSITGLAYNGFINDKIKVECVYESNRFVIRIKSTDITDGDYVGFVAVKSITVMSYNHIENIGYMATDEWEVVDGSNVITNYLVFDRSAATPSYVQTAVECTGTSSSANTLVNGGWTITTDKDGNIIFINNGVVKTTITTTGNIIASNLTEQ